MAKLKIHNINRDLEILNNMYGNETKYNSGTTSNGQEKPQRKYRKAKGNKVEEEVRGDETGVLSEVRMPD